MTYTYAEVYKATLEYFDGDKLATETWMNKYALSKDRVVYDELTPNDTHRRLAREFSRIEQKYSNPMSEDEIFELLKGFKKIVLQGSPMSALGNPYVIQSAGNCYILGSPYDSYGGILHNDQKLVQLCKRRCVEENTRVFTKEKGPISIKDLFVGMHVLSYDVENRQSTYRKVLHKENVFVSPKDKIKVQFSDGTQLRVSKDHPVLCFGENGFCYRSAGLLSEGDVCLRPEKRLDFDIINDDIAWWVGMHLGDGTADISFVNGSKSPKTGRRYIWRRSRIRITDSDEKCVSEYARILNQLTGSRSRYRPSTRKEYKVMMWEYSNNKRDTEYVIDGYLDGQKGKKTYTAFVPDYIKDNFLWFSFIAGIIDAEGHVRNGERIDIDMCAKEIIDDISVFVSGYGIRSFTRIRYPRRQNESDLYCIEINGEEDLWNSSFFDLLRHNQKKTLLKEKKKTLREFSHKFYLTTQEKSSILSRYEELRWKERIDKNEEKARWEERRNFLACVGLLKRNEPECGPIAGIGTLNICSKYGILDNKKEVLQRIQVVSVEEDSSEGNYIDVEVDEFNNFYAGNFGLVCVHNCGVGFDISTLRPRGMPTRNAAKSTDGVKVFMERYSNSTREVAQNNRRGALLLSISVHHPEVRTFIKAKQNKDKITGANISVRISDEFMEAVEKGEKVQLRWPVDEIKNPKIEQRVDARQLWNEIVYSGWSFSEPGILLWDTVIRNSPADCYAENNESFKTCSTNPCGEIPSGPDSCRLTLINLFSFVKNPFTKQSKFDYEYFSKITKKAQRFMDDLVDLELELMDKIINKVESDPEPEYIKAVEKNMWLDFRDTCEKGRRTGLGVTGLGDTLAALGIQYGSEKAIQVTEEIYKHLCLNAYRSSCILAKERGTFPIYDSEKEKDNPYLQRIFKEDPEIQKMCEETGRRNIALTTTAPAGSVSLLTQTTSGFEPLFLTEYTRRRKLDDFETIEPDLVDELGDRWIEYDVVHCPWMKWQEISGETDIEKSPYHKATANEIDWSNKIKMQGVAQRWVCHAISNTLSMPKEATVDTVKEAYMQAWKSGVKGITVYREGSRLGVLVKKNDTTEKSFVFVLEDGSCLQVQDGETVEYDGKIYKASELFRVTQTT